MHIYIHSVSPRSRQYIRSQTIRSVIKIHATLKHYVISLSVSPQIAHGS